jgi:hypothetical protein
MPVSVAEKGRARCETITMTSLQAAQSCAEFSLRDPLATCYLRKKVEMPYLYLVPVPGTVSPGTW